MSSFQYRTSPSTSADDKLANFADCALTVSANYMCTEPDEHTQMHEQEEYVAGLLALNKPSGNFVLQEVKESSGEDKPIIHEIRSHSWMSRGNNALPSGDTITPRNLMVSEKLKPGTKSKKQRIGRREELRRKKNALQVMLEAKPMALRPLPPIRSFIMSAFMEQPTDREEMSLTEIDHKSAPPNNLKEDASVKVSPKFSKDLDNPRPSKAEDFRAKARERRFKNRKPLGLNAFKEDKLVNVCPQRSEDLENDPKPSTTKDLRKKARERRLKKEALQAMLKVNPAPVEPFFSIRSLVMEAILDSLKESEIGNDSKHIPRLS